MISAGFISGAAIGNVKPSSLDLTLSDEIYKVEGVFQPRPGETVRQVLEKIKKETHSFDRPLMRNQMYIIRLNETLTLPSDVYGYCNPKSSSGRVDIHVRMIADGVSRYDTLNKGWKGELWVSVVPKSFPVKMSPGQSYNQLRFFNEDTRLSNTELQIFMQDSKLLWKLDGSNAYTFNDLTVHDNDGAIIQQLDLSTDIVGYIGIQSDTVVDLGKIKHYDSADFFKPIEKEGDFVYLKKDQFYILSTHEAVRIPPELACEMVPMDERSGEFRSHYAGFIDPGWGWGKEGESNGRPLTLEVRPFEDIIVRHKQPIAKIRFERMAELPDVVYDSMDSNYLKQTGPKLGKNFK